MKGEINQMVGERCQFRNQFVNPNPFAEDALGFLFPICNVSLGRSPNVMGGGGGGGGGESGRESSLYSG